MPKKDIYHAETRWDMKVALEHNDLAHVEPHGKDVEITGPITEPIRSMRLTPDCRSISKKERNVILDMLKLMGITVEIFLLVGGWAHFFLHL